MTDKDATQHNEDRLTALKARIINEPISSFFNIKILEISQGYARVSMKMRPEYLNFNGVIFGGIITAVADHAFSLAINSLAMPSLATQFNIHLLASAVVNDELIGEGKVIRSGKRVGISEMTVTNQSGKLIAKATGTTIPVENKG
jgi:acyl-CoA thioesterase